MPNLRRARFGGAAVPSSERVTYRVGALAGVAGLVLQIAIAGFHAGTIDPNRSAEVFREYAASNAWTAVHVGQLAGTLLIVGGLLTVAGSAARSGGVARAFAHASTFAFVLVAAVFTVQMAVDGVVLREAISAWISAAPEDKASAFLVADTVRWLEKALSAFFHLTNGTGLVLVGLSIATGRIHAWGLGLVGVAAGLGFMYGGWVTANSGFSTEASAVISPVALIGAVFVIGSAISVVRRTIAEPGDVTVGRPAAVQAG